MANKNLFKSLMGRIAPRTDAVNEAGGVAYARSSKHALAQYAMTGCLNGTFYASAEMQLGKVLDFEHRGYVVIDVTTERIHGDWYFVDDIKDPDAGAEVWAFGYECADMARHMVAADEAGDMADAPDLAP